MRVVSDTALPRDYAALAASRQAVTGQLMDLLRTLATIGLFALGGLVWVCQPKYAMGTALIIPISPPQIAISLGAALSLLVLLIRGRGRLPNLFRPGFASAVILFSFALVLAGIFVHLRPGPYLLDTLQFLDRWLLPVFATLLLHLALLLRAPVVALVYGFCAGLAFTVLSIEAAKRGVALPVGILSDGRYSGYLNHPNQYGIVISGLAPFLVFLVQDRRWWNRGLAVLLLGVFALGLAQSLSKTNFALFPLSLGMTFLICALGSSRALLRSVGVVAIMSVLLLAAGWVGLQVLRNYSPRDAQIVEDALIDPGNASTVEDRENVWAEARGFIDQSPIFGKGPGWSEDNLMVNHAHNLYLQIWLDAGLAGFIGAWILTFGTVVRLGGVAREVVRAGWPPSERLRLQVAATVGMLISIMGNSMSSSFHTGTFVPFAVLTAISLIHPVWLDEAAQARSESEEYARG